MAGQFKQPMPYISLHTLAGIESVEAAKEKLSNALLAAKAGGAH